MSSPILSADSPDQSRRWKFGHCEFIEISRQLLVNGGPVKLESKPLDVLVQLLERAPQIVSKDDLLGSAWPTATADQSLTTAISKLRKAFGGLRDSIILSVSGVGYRMAVPVICLTEQAPDPTPFYLKVGDAVPGRENWIAERPLSVGEHPSVWMAMHRKTHEARVFKFATDGVRLRGLQREVTLSRIFSEKLRGQPGFVRILDWQFDDIPFIIESPYCGLNLFQFAETEEFEQMPLQERVLIAAEIAEAVAAAHGLGILHNDIKPGNILVAPRDNERSALGIKVVDFGVASVTDARLLTEMQITHYGVFDESDRGKEKKLAGTALYRAPELLSPGAMPTMLGDVYSLGILLYQIVTGDFLETPSPGWESRVPDALLREDIATAAAIDPKLRMASAEELARRLRSLDTRRVEERQKQEKAADTLRLEERDRRNRQRRPWVIVATSALVLGLAVSLWFYHRAVQERDAAVAAATRAQRLERFTESLFTSGDDRVPQKGLTVEFLLERGVKQAQAMNSDKAEQAEMLATLGKVYDDLGSFDTANQLLQDALKERQELFGADSPEVAATLVPLSALRSSQEQLDQAVAYAERAYSIDAKKLPLDDAQTLEAEIQLGSAWESKDDFKVAIPMLQHVIRKETGKANRLFDLSDALNDLGIAEIYVGNLNEAFRLNDQSMAIDKQTLGDTHPDIAAHLINRSQLEQEAGNYSAGEKDSRAALAIYRNWLPPGHYEIASAETTVSDALIRENKADEAVPLLADSLRSQQAHFPGANVRTAHTLAALGSAEQALHHSDAALGYYQQAASQYRALFDRDYRLGIMLFNIGKIYCEQRRYPEAAQVLKEAADIQTRRLPPTDKRLIETKLLLAHVEEISRQKQQ